MEDKRPIDRKRESGGYADVGSIEDGAIVELLDISGKLIIIKEKSIYEMIFADKVDPNRTNINLPPTILKLVIDKGVESEIVSRTFLTAKTLFRREFFSSSINCDDILGLTVDMLSEISILEKEIKGLVDDEDIVTHDFEIRRNQKVSYEIPSMVNLESRCKTVFQKADHIEQTLMEIIIIIYPNDGLKKQSHFPKFLEIIKAKL